MKRQYSHGKRRATRKHDWLPCVLSREIQSTADPGKAIEIEARSYFMDYFTDAEWRAIVGKAPAGDRVNKARIKRKVAGWLMAMGRLALLQPDWYSEAARKACSEYQGLLGEPLRWGILPERRP